MDFKHYAHVSDKRTEHASTTSYMPTRTFNTSPVLPSIFLLHLQCVAHKVWVAAIPPFELEAVGGCGKTLQPGGTGGQGPGGHLGGGAVGTHADAIHCLDADSTTHSR